VSYEHQSVTAQLETVRPASAKLVLFQLADRACVVCGMAWPGVPWLMRKTGMSDTGVRSGIEALKAQGLIVPKDFLTGGRGRTVEYIVLPGLMELSTGPCGECQKRMKRYRVPGGIANRKRSQKQNPPPGEGYSVKQTSNPPESTPETPRQAVPIQSDIHNSVTARARELKAATPPASEPTTNPVPEPDTSPHQAIHSYLDGLRTKFGPSSRS
jgi:hypothetical protein